MLHGPIWNKIPQFALPVAATAILEQLFNASDIAVVGNFTGAGRTIAVAAVGANSPLIGLIVNLFIGIAFGTNVVIAHAIGHGNKEDVRKAVHTSVLLALLGGMLVAVAGELIAAPVLGLLNVPEDVFPLALLYLRIYLAGMPVILLYNFEAAIFRSVGETKIPLMALLASGILNVILNLFFVAVLHMTVNGVAIATVISNAVSSVLLYRKLRQTTQDIHLDPKLLRIDIGILKRNLQIGLPAGVQSAVFRITDQAACEEAVVQAIQSGYRLIDTAAAYGNEEAVGRAIRRCGVPRENLFIITKLWIPDISYEGAKRGFALSLEKLGLDYLDLYVIHQPYHDVFGAWRAMEELFTEGRARAIGVDNFTQDHLADFLFWNKVKPAVNLLECNPFFQREDERTYLKTQEIQMQAWSPLSAGQNDLFHNEILCKIGVAHGKSAAQVVLRWLTQRGIVPLVKSSNSQRMKENLDIFDFTLSENEMQQIATLDTGHTCFAPRSTGASVTAFLEQAVAG